MDDAGPRPESHAKGFQSLPFEAVLLRRLAAPAQPQPLQVAPEAAQVRVAGRRRVVFQPPVQHLSEPLRGRVLVRVHAPIRALRHRLAPQSEPPTSCPSAIVGESEKIEGLRLALPASLPVRCREPSKCTRAGVSCRRADPIRTWRASPSRPAGSVPHRCGLGSRPRSHRYSTRRTSRLAPLSVSMRPGPTRPAHGGSSTQPAPVKSPSLARFPVLCRTRGHLPSLRCAAGWEPAAERSGAAAADLGSAPPRAPSGGLSRCGPSTFTSASSTRLILRRQCISVVGGGLFIPAAGEVGFSPNIATAQFPPSSGLQIGEDGSLTGLTGKVGVGQGSRKDILQVAAEELHVAPEMLRVILAGAAATSDEGSTPGSQSACSCTDPVR